MTRSFLAASVLAFVISPAILLSQSFGPVTVPATAAIFDPDGAVTASNLSKLGATPAVEALSFTAGPGRVFTFTASGKVGSFAPPPNIGPDGSGSSVNITSLGSISGFAFPVGFPLVGVFTNGAPTGPAPANYNYAGGGSQATFAPQLNQVFFIGDGLTGTGSGSQQTFFVPATATQLWLGLTDTAANGVGAPGGYGDNPGSFTVSGTLAPGPACTSVIQNAVTVKIGGALSSNLAPTSMLATFAPNGLTLADAASACGVTGFNWQQWVDTLPAPNPFNCADSTACGLTPATSITAPPRFLDPVNGGYSTNTGQTTGRYPFFYSTANLTSGCNQVGTSCTPIETDTALNFADTPADNQLPAGSFMVFTTALVGMVPCSTPSCTGNVPGPVLYTWDWLSSFSGTAGGVSRIGNFSTAPDAGSGAGGVTILSENGVSQVTGPSVSVNGAVNAGSYAANAPLAPGSIAAVFGTFPITGSASATQLPLPTSLDGLSMTFAGVPAHLFYASSGQVNMQIPWETEGLTQAAVTVTVGGQTSIPQTVAIAPFAPSIFSVNGQGTGQGAIQDPYFRLVDTTNPAPANGVVVIYCTGLGAVTNQPADGAAAPSSPLARTTTLPTVTIGGVDAPVSFSGLVPGLAGLYQVNAQVSPTLAANAAAPVIISIGGVQSNTVTIAVAGQ